MLSSNLARNHYINKAFLLFFLILAGCNLSNDSGSYTPDPVDHPSSSYIDPCSINIHSPTLRNNYGTEADPLFPYQWYLKNTGQEASAAFAGEKGISGADMNWLTLPEDKRKGKGVIIAVVDSGLEIGHEDLEQNVVRDGSWDFNCNDPNPTSLSTRGDHGTSVAGIIAARSNNGIGISGIAGEASLKGFNVLASDQSEQKFLAALGGSDREPNSSDVSIFNQSYGLDTIHDTLASGSDFKLLESQYKIAVDTFRDGKGAIYVKAAGNGFLGYVGEEDADCERANEYGVSCQNSNMEHEGVIPYNIVVGAVNADGEHSSYSTAGSSLWISAPGGESGIDLNYLKKRNPKIDASKAPVNFFKPAIVTTDQSGCVNGYSPRLLYNSFQDGTHRLNSNCNYTSTFNGTSSAAPMVSGVVALMLAANSNLSWRDVKYILAKTAKKIDENDKPVIMLIQDSSNNMYYKAKLGWVTNKANYHFHNYYGFGAIDVKAAVDMVTGYGVDLGSFIEKSWEDSQSSGLPLSIPGYEFVRVSNANTANTNLGVTDTINYTNDLTIEMVQVGVKITHPYTGGLGIKLTSPSGTESILLNIANGFGADHDLDMYLASNAFYGEPTKGDWKINIVDLSNNGGQLDSWKIRFYGH